MMTIETQKAEVRAEVSKKIKAFSPEIREAKNTQIKNRVEQSFIFKTSQVIMFYMSINEEVETRSLIQAALKAGNRVVLPRVSTCGTELEPIEIKGVEDDLSLGSFGIREPKSSLQAHFDIEQIKLILVPGVAFDKMGHRLGRGKGYYDRFLKVIPRDVIRLGLAFEDQLVDHLPTLEHDELMDYIMTEYGEIKCQEARES